jgi:hypothetical protein
MRMRRVVDCDHLIDGGNLLLDGFNPEGELLDFAEQLGAFPFQFLFNAHVAPLQKWSRRLPDELVQVWWLLLPNAASLRQFCPTVDDIGREPRLIERAMDRCRRATSPDNYNPDGTAKKGARKWVYLSRYKDLRDEKADAERRLASEGKRSHGEDINRTLALGHVFKLEKLSYRAWQKCFGRSVRRRAPGTYVSQLIRKAARAGGEVIEIDTWKTRLSQFDHKSGEYRKKKLSERWHVLLACLRRRHARAAGFVLGVAGEPGP